jgi:methionyl-tRNA formyltransferase
MERLSMIGADLLSETLRNLNNIAPSKQNDAEATLAPLMKKDDGLIDWSLNAVEIANRVRGFQPFPTAHTNYQNKKLTLWRAESLSRVAPDIPTLGR